MEAGGGEAGGTQILRAVIRPCWQRWLTATEAAGRLGWSENTVYRYLGNGQIPGAVMLGGRWQIAAWELEAWAQGWWDPAVEPWVDWAARNGLGDLGAE